LKRRRGPVILVFLILVGFTGIFRIPDARSMGVVLTPPPGTYHEPVVLRFAVPAGAEVHFTLDGSEPTVRSPAFKSPVTIGEDTVIRYFTVDVSGIMGAVKEAFYRIDLPDSRKDRLLTVANPPGGHFSRGVWVKLEGRAGAALYYTIDGSDPDTSSPVFTSPILLTNDTVLKFFSMGSDGTREPVRSERYSFSLTEKIVDTTPPEPTVAPSPGEYKIGDLVHLEANEECEFYYTLDGSKPTEKSIKYENPFPIQGNTVLRFFAVDRAHNRSEIHVAKYVVDTVPAESRTIPAPGLYVPPLTVRIETSEEDAVVHFTLDGSDPGVDSHVYNAPLVLNYHTIIKYFSVDRMGNREEVKTAEYTFDSTPPETEVTPPGGEYRPPVSVTLETEEGAAIHYTLDGSTPDMNSPVYSNTLTFKVPTVLKLFAVDNLGNEEAVQTHRYRFINGVWRKYARGVFLLPSVTDGHTFWMGSEAGLVVYTVGSGSQQFVGQREGFLGNTINDMVLDEEDNLWVATEAGITVMKKRGGFFHIGKKQGLPSEEVISLGVDIDNSVWAGTKNGVAHIKRNVVLEILEKKDGLVDNTVLAIAVDALGNKWFGTKKGLSKFTGSEWHNFTRESGLIRNEVRTVALDSHWNVWCGTPDGISVFDGTGWRSYRQKDGLPSDAITLITPDVDGDIWVATRGGVARFTGDHWVKEELP